jgi:carbonic anhydrase
MSGTKEASMTRAHHVSRRRVIGGFLASSAATVASRPARAASPEKTGRDPDAVLAELIAGNRRFASGQTESPRRRPEDFSALAAGQSPEAVIVSCADSRVPVEILFDQGVGDLFVVRVAGNVVNDAGVVVKGSIEYAVAELGVPLIVVLGHSQCGAVKAALDHVAARDALPGAIGGLVNAIRPAVTASKGKPGDALHNAIRANVELGVARLKSLAPIVGPAVKRKSVKAVGAVYDLKTGEVALIG